MQQNNNISSTFSKYCIGYCGFGFNGQEKDQEIYNNQSTTTATFWEYDGRIGRRWNLDPEGKTGVSDYSAFYNCPIWFNDVKGNKPGEYEKTVNDDGTETTKKVSDLGGNKVDFTHIKGGEHDGQTEIKSNKTGESVYMASSKNIKGYTHRKGGTDWDKIYKEFLTGTGPENSLITTPGMLTEIMKSPQFTEAFKAYKAAGSPAKMGYESSFGIPGLVKSGDNMTAQMLGKSNYSFYNVGDHLIITVMDSKSVSSYYWIAKIVPESWVNKDREARKIIPESTTRQTYLMIFPIKKQ